MAGLMALALPSSFEGQPGLGGSMCPQGHEVPSSQCSLV